MRIPPIILLILALAYLVIPFDLIPDFLGPLGRIDDLLLLGYVLFRVYRSKRLVDTAEDAFSGHSSNRTGNEEALKTKPPRSPHEIIGVPKDASAEDIRKAYKKLAAEYHPDKVSHLGDELRELAHSKMLEIQAAYETLKKNKRL